MARKDPAATRAYNKAYYEANRDDPRDVDKRRAIWRASYHRHRAEKREQCNARVKAYDASHAAAKAERLRVYYLSRSEELKAAKRKRDAAHPEKCAEYTARRRALIAKTTVEKIDFMQILIDANGLCGICKQPLDLFGIDFDHKIPLSKGGAHVRANIQASHARCNRSKGAKVA